MPLMATLPLLGVWALAVLSPRPDFLAVLRESAGRSRRSGLLVAAGVVSGIAVWAVAGMLGVTLLIARFAWLYTAVRIAGALSLIGFGIATLRSVRGSAPPPSAESGTPEPANSGWLPGKFTPSAIGWW